MTEHLTPSEKKLKIEKAPPGEENPNAILNETRKTALAASKTAKYVEVFALREENQKLRAQIAQLEEQLGRDHLTGAYSRKKFEEELTRLQEKAEKAKQAQRVSDTPESSEAVNDEPFSLIYFDIDLFKKVNDVYGHPVGDEVLKQLVQRVQGHLREEDFFARVGGEEFAIIAIANYENTISIAKKLRKLIYETPFKTKAGKIQISISMGVSSFNANSKKMINWADEALYVAKNSGRNQVFVFDPKQSSFDSV